MIFFCGDGYSVELLLSGQSVESAHLALRFRQSLLHLDAPESFSTTVRNIPLDCSPDVHMSAVRAWAASTWEDWSEHHDFIKRWRETVFNPAQRY